MVGGIIKEPQEPFIVVKKTLPGLLFGLLFEPLDQFRKNELLFGWTHKGFSKMTTTHPFLIATVQLRGLPRWLICFHWSQKL
jgi:hypothetical protein